MASICDSDICVRVRPHLICWHRYVILIYVITCKTTSGTLVLYNMCDYLSILFNFEWFSEQ
ncbi:hypothetical protein F383_37263 [Gossypium arboreum]|uniref:Uncharacterized protein n=1 Tax=Gossypium arboreum TaxID=29729 RepID=A0A0B0MF20_GOSAR|nr:hypothetical protein F383_37263 [Gossypium arboreum]